MFPALLTSRLPRSLTLAALLFLWAPTLSAELPQPDHVIWGRVQLNSEPAVAGGLVQLSIDGDLRIVADYVLGSDPNLVEGGALLFSLRVPMDGVGDRVAGLARPGDRVAIFLDGALAAEAILGAEGSAQRLDIDPATVPDPPILHIHDAALVEGEAGPRGLELALSLSRPVNETVRVDWSTADGTAEAGLDYQAESGTVVFDPGEQHAEVAITIFDDSLEEAVPLERILGETFEVRLSNPQSATLASVSATATILDDDTPPALEIFGTSAVEPPAGAIEVSLILRLTNPWHEAVMVEYQALDGSAETDLDFQLNAGSLRFEAGELEGRIAVRILADGDTGEGDENFWIQLFSPQNASLLNEEAEVTILVEAPVLRFIEAESNGGELGDELAGVIDLAISPEGRHLYAAGRSADSVLLFDRQAPGDRLEAIASYRDGEPGTFDLNGPESVAVSPDGLHVYVGAFLDSAITIFSRDAESGLLSLTDVIRDGAPAQDSDGIIDGLKGVTDMVLDAAGTTLYAAGFNDDAIAAFRRDPASGTLSFLGAVRDDTAGVEGLAKVSALALAGESHLYAAGFGDDAIAIFERSEDGSLLFSHTIRDTFDSAHLAGPAALAVAPDGGTIYVAAQDDDALLVFDRDPISGSLDERQVLIAGANPSLGAPTDVVLSHDGRFLYLAGFDQDALGVFAIGADGLLSPIEHHLHDVEGVSGLEGPGAIAVSPDDAGVYIAGSFSDAVVVFSRDLHAPEPPELSSTSHQTNIYSNLAVLEMTWSGAHDDDLGTGMAFYRHAVGPSSDTLPAEFVEISHGLDPHQVAAGPLADGTHYFLLESCDWAENCSFTQAGPFLLDTMAPGPISDLSSTTHLPGVPVDATQVALTWASAVDPGSEASGLASYAYTFTPVSTWSCDADAISVTEPMVTSEPLAEGDWYFHLCAIDGAGNQGPVSSLGPLIIRSDIEPPVVERVSTVSASPTGSLEVWEQTEHAITQVRLHFSEAMGESGPGNAGDPSSYLLIEAGPDQILETAVCGVAAGDDVLSTLLDASHDTPNREVALVIETSSALEEGSYRLLACGSLEDSSGNRLDGDGDGEAGDDFSFDFSVLSTNLFLNPNIDQDLQAWSSDTDLEAVFNYSTQDADSASTSGSAYLANGLPAQLYKLFQCVDLGDRSGSFRLAGRVQIIEEATTPTSATAAIDFFSAPDCQGSASASLLSPEVTSDGLELWHELALQAETVPGATSALVRFLVLGGDIHFEASFDNLLFQLPYGGIFSDDFESGDLSAWSNF